MGIAALLLVAAIGMRIRAAREISCASVAERATTSQDYAAAAGAIGALCREDDWSEEQRTCVANAATAAAIADCVPERTKRSIPTPEPTASTRARLAALPPAPMRIAGSIAGSDPGFPAIRDYFGALGVAVAPSTDDDDRISRATYGDRPYRGLLLVRGAPGLEEATPIAWQTGSTEAASAANLDDAFATALRGIRPHRGVAYLTSGHGELTDVPEHVTHRFVRWLGEFDLDVRPLPPGAVPADASAVIVAAPTKPLAPADEAALVAYLDRGGHVFEIAGATTTALPLLEPRIGVARHPGYIDDEDPPLPMTHAVGFDTTDAHAHVLKRSAHGDAVFVVSMGEPPGWRAAVIGTPDAIVDGYMTLSELALELAGPASLVLGKRSGPSYEPFERDGVAAHLVAALFATGTERALQQRHLADASGDASDRYR
ncbi:MAG TPA: Gldg family protein [Kofleriaceae bacterium]